MIAAKAFDPVLGVDVHIVQPPGPVPPVPVPHPFVGMLIDPMDFAPIIGSSVSVNGLPRATAGTGGQCIPPHIPIGGVFVKPPANEAEVFMGSSTVLADGDPLSFLGMPALSCSDIGMPPIPRINKKRKTKSLVLPTSVVLSVPGGAPVLVGGPPTVSMMALGMRAGMAGLGRAFKRLAKTKAFKKLARKFKKAKQKAFKNMKPGFVKCNVLKAEPVDIVTGEVVIDQTDFDLPWRIPLTWNRLYRSSSRRKGSCGWGWETPADARLEFDRDGVVAFYDGTPGAAVFPHSPSSGSVTEIVSGARLEVIDEGLAVRTKAGLTYHFPRPAAVPGEVVASLITDRNGNSITFVRRSGVLIEIRESSGIRIHVDSVAQRIHRMYLQHPDEPSRRLLVTYEYDGDDLTTVRDALNHAYRFQYDQHRLVRHTNRVGLAFYYEYGVEGASGARVERAWGDGGLYDYKFEYDVGSTTYVDSLGGVWVTQHADGLGIREIDPLGGHTTYEYDEMGRPIAEEDPGGARTAYSYDDHGNLIEVTRADGSTLRAEYDEYDNTVEIVDPRGGKWSTQYDSRGLATARRRPGGSVERFEYSESGDLLAVIDPLGRETRFWYNAHGDVVGRLDPDGARHDFEVDALGNIVRWLRPDGQAVEYGRDPCGRLTSVTEPGPRRWDFAYDAEGNGVARRKPGGGTVRRDFVGLGEVSRVIESDGYTLEYRYDSEERVIGIRRPGGGEYTIERDPLGRPVVETDYWGVTRRFRYDAHGHLTNVTEAAGRESNFAHDALGRVVGARYSDGQEELFEYDASGNLVCASNASGRVLRQFDSEGNLVHEAFAGFEVRSEYDAVGNRIHCKWSESDSVAFKFDGKDRLEALEVGGQRILRRSYDHMGLRLRDQWDGGLQRDLSYDSSGLLVQELLLRPGTDSEVVRQYRYDADGNPIHIRGGLGDVQKPELNRAGRLIGTVGATRDNVREAVRADTRARFDPWGNLVGLKEPGRRLELSWDAKNQLKTVRTRSGALIEFEYDALGRRVEKRGPEGRVRFDWDGDFLVRETRVGGEPPRSVNYVLEPLSFEPLVALTDGVCVYSNDCVGLPRAVFDSDGTELWAARFDVSGQLEGERGMAGARNDLRFPGQYHDRETGLYYNRFRYFHPPTGCFISRDPIGRRGGECLYEYAPHPWAWIDPLGLTCKGKKVVWQIKDNFPPGSYESRQLRRFVKAWNEEIQKAGGSMRRRTRGLTPGQEAASARWKREMRQRYPDRFDGKVVGHTPDACAGGPVAGGRAMALDPSVNSSVGGQLRSGPRGEYHEVVVVR